MEGHRILRKSLTIFLIGFFGFYFSPYFSTATFGSTPASCEIWDDEQGIPHIHAADTLSGIACLGYIHGRDRAWEMDFFKKTVQGRKAEFFGMSSFRSDFFLRILNLPEKAKAIFKQMNPQDQSIFQAYARGANQGMKEAVDRGVYEFNELGYLPEPWSPEDSLSLILLQSFDQTRRSFQIQLDQRKWEEKQGDQASSLFNPIDLPWDTSILKEGEYPKSSSQKPNQSKTQSQNQHSVPESIALQELLTTESYLQLSSVWQGPGTGSNNWVISPRRSQSHHAWLANDPHLRLTRPAFWHWIHLDAGDINAIGATFPGVPFIASGANLHLSWGLTNSFLPAARLVAVSEKELQGKNEAQSFWPVIWVKVWKFKLPFFFKSFRRTPKSFPILPLPSSAEKALVLQWTGFDLLAKEITPFFDLMKSHSVAEADQVLSQVGVPSWNFVLADDQGGVGYRAVGRIPRQEKNDSFGIPVETLEQIENSPALTHPLAPSEMPHTLNPARGYIATANNQQWPKDARWSQGKAHEFGFRAFRIEELLQKTKFHNLASSQRIQCDVQAVDARFVLPQLLTILEKKVAASDLKTVILPALDVLKNWNYETNRECVACGLYRRWMNRLNDDLQVNINALYRKLNLPIEPAFETSVYDSFLLALEDLKFMKNQTLLSWGQVHLNSFGHLAGDEFFRVKAISTPGDDFSVNPGSSEWMQDHFSHYAGASQRLIVEMSQPPEVYAVLAGANQDIANPQLDSPDSEWERWAQCKLQRKNFPVDWTKIKGQVKRVVFDFSF